MSRKINFSEIVAVFLLVVIGGNAVWGNCGEQKKDLSQ